MDKQTIKEFEKLLIDEKVSLAEIFSNASYYYNFDKEELCELASEVLYQAMYYEVELTPLDSTNDFLTKKVIGSLKERSEN